jgi:cytochrome b561
MSSATAVFRAVEVPRYPMVVRALHWLTAALILVMFILGGWIVYFEPKDQVFDHTLYNLHESTGVTIWLLTVLRVGLRLTLGGTRLADDTPPALRVLATLNQLGLYAMLLVMPVLGLLDANSWGVSPRWYGTVQVPALIAQRPDAIAQQFSNVHRWGAITLLVLLGLHLVGVAYHGIVRRDGVVQHMV